MIQNILSRTKRKGAKKLNEVAILSLEALLLCNHLQFFGTNFAKRQKLSEEDAREFGVRFVEQILIRSQKIPKNLLVSNTFLFACARNLWKSDLRSRHIKERHELTCSQCSQIQTVDFPDIFGSSLSMPERSAINEEFYAVLERATKHLQPFPREIFYLHYLEGISISELANMADKTPNAIYKSLERACKSIRKNLERQGMGEQEMRDYVRLTLPPHIRLLH